MTTFYFATHPTLNRPVDFTVDGEVYRSLAKGDGDAPPLSLEEIGLYYTLRSMGCCALSDLTNYSSDSTDRLSAVLTSLVQQGWVKEGAQ